MKKMQNYETLTSALLSLNDGESVEVPYKMYSERSIRSYVSQLKSKYSITFSVNSRGSKSAVITKEV